MPRPGSPFERETQALMRPMVALRELVMILVGRLLGTVEVAARRARQRARPNTLSASDDLDRTGRVVSHAPKIAIAWRDKDVVFPVYESLAHSFWRAQELSLLQQVSNQLGEPRMDLGCGDGSFSALIFDRVAFGVDKDEVALDTARLAGIYDTLLLGTDETIPIGTGAAESVLSNSTLEHVVDIDSLLAEVARVVRPGGVLAVTVPIRGFDRHLARYFGAGFSRQMNADYFHRNLFEPDGWRRKLEAAGFDIVSTRRYQPSSFTFLYVILRYAGSRRGLGRLIPGFRALLWKVSGPRLVAMVRASILGDHPDGANVLVLARRTGLDAGVRPPTGSAPPG